LTNLGFTPTLGTVNISTLLTSAQVAERLGCDIRTVHRHHKAGKLPAAMRVPGYKGALLFDPEVVDLLGKPPAGTDEVKP
jgi:hypothetical protein